MKYNKYYTVIKHKFKRVQNRLTNRMTSLLGSEEGPYCGHFHREISCTPKNKAASAIRIPVLRPCGSRRRRETRIFTSIIIISYFSSPPLLMLFLCSYLHLLSYNSVQITQKENKHLNTVY